MALTFTSALEAIGELKTRINALDHTSASDISFLQSLVDNVWTQVSAREALYSIPHDAPTGTEGTMAFIEGQIGQLTARIAHLETLGAP